MNAPILSADETGVWRESAPGRRYGIAWDEIYHISGGKLDCIEYTLTTVELDWEYGEYLELVEAWPGFEDVVRAITARMKGIAPDWIDRVRALPTSQALVVWKRDEPALEI